MSHKGDIDLSKESEQAFSEAGGNVEDPSGGKESKFSRDIRKRDEEVLDKVLESGGGTEAAHMNIKRHHTKRNVILVVCLILVLAIVGVAVGFMFTGSPENIVDYGYETANYELPEDGSTPLDHTGVENIGYMNHKLHSQEYYYAEMHGTVNTIMTQQITTYKQYYNGVLISSDITTSSMINSAVQFCTTDDRVIWRNAAGGASTFKGLDTEYSTGAPLGSCTIAEFKVLRGFPPSEFSVYVLNEDTIDDWFDVTDNGDGTYTQTFYLHVASEPYENSAIYYYKQQMVATGGLTDFPTFTSSQITYTFDSEWQVLKAEVYEAYKATMGVSVNCTSSSTTEYTYGDISLCENTAYEDYFSQYADVDIAPEEAELTATDCLAQAFGTVLTDPVTFSLDMSVNGQPLSGLLYLDINSMDIRADIGNIQLYIEEPDDDFMWLYLSYGDDTKIKLDINSIDLSAFSSSSGDGDGSGDDGSSGGLSLDTDELLADLSGGEFTVTDDGSVATLDSVLNLFGLTVPVDFVFNIDESGNITLGNVSATLSLLGIDMDISICFTDEDVPALTAAEKDAYMDIDDNVDSLINLIATFTSNEQEFYLEYGTDSFDLTVSLSLDLANSLAKGEVDIWFGSGTWKYIGIDYKDGNLYLTLDSEDMDALKIKANMDEAVDLISSFLSTDSADSEDTDEYAIATVADKETESSSTDLSSILASLNIDLGDIVYRLLADRDFANTLHITEDGQFEIDATELLAIFDVDLNLGTIYLVADENGISVDDGPFDFTLTQGEPFTVDETYYVEAEDLVTLVEEIEKLIEGQSVGLTGAIEVAVGGAVIDVTIDNLTIDWSDGVSVYLHISFDLGSSTQDICVLYTGSTNTLQLAYGNTGLELCFDTGSGTDLEKLENSLVAAYDKIAEIANIYLADDSKWDTDAGTLQDILTGFGVAIDTTESAEDLISEILGLFSGTDSGSGSSFDIMSLLGEMSFGLGPHSGFEVKIAGVDLEITDVSRDHNNEFYMDINLAYAGDSFSIELQDWTVSAGSLTAMPETVQYVTADSLANLIDSITATAAILTGTTEIDITYESSGMAISAEILFSLQDSNASGLITATFSSSEDANTKYIGFSYEDGMFYLSLYTDSTDPFLVKASVSDTITLISSFFTSSGDDTATAAEDEEAVEETSGLLATIMSIVDSETVGSIMDSLFVGGGFFDIFSTSASTFKLDIAALCSVLGVTTDLGDAYFSMGADGIILDLDDAYGVSMIICGTDSSVDAKSGDYADAEDLIALVDEIIEIVDSQSVGLSGAISVSVSGTDIDVSLDTVNIDWSNGINLYIAASFKLNNVTQNVYVAYNSKTNLLQVAYGQVGLELCFNTGSGSDMEKLEKALVTAYNEIAEIANYYLAEDKTLDTNATTLNGILTSLGLAIDGTDSLESLITELIGSSGEGDGLDVYEILDGLTYGQSSNGGFGLSVLGVDVSIKDNSTEDNPKFTIDLSYSSETFALDLTDWTITTGDVYTMPTDIEYVTADDIAVLLDALANTAEILTGTTEITASYTSDSIVVKADILFSLEKSEASGTISVDITTTDEDTANTTKYITFSYTNKIVYLGLYSDGIDPYYVKASVSEASELINKLIDLFSGDDEDPAAAASVADIATVASIADLSVADIISAIFTDGEFFNILKKDNTDRVFTIDIQAICGLLGLNVDLGECTFNMGDGHVTLGTSTYGVSLDIHAADEDVSINTEAHDNAEDLIALVDEIIEIVDSKSVGLSGAITVTVNDTVVPVSLDTVNIDWSNGINLYIAASFKLNNVTQNVYVAYNSKTNLLQVAYGQVGLELCFNTGTDTDMEKLEKALVAAYNEIAEIVNYYLAEDKALDTTQTTLNGILTSLGLAIDGTDSLEDLITELLGSNGEGDGLDVYEILDGLTYGQSSNGGFGLSILGVKLSIKDNSTTGEDSKINPEFTIDLSYSSETFALDLTDWTITTGDVYTMPDIEYVTADDIAVLLDALANTAKILTDTTEIEAKYESDSIVVKADILFSLEKSEASGTISIDILTTTTDEETGEESTEKTGTTKYITFSYTNKMVYLGLYSEDMDPYYAKASVSEASDLINKLIDLFSGDDEDPAAAASVADIATVASIADLSVADIISAVFTEGKFFDILQTDNDRRIFTIDIQAICDLLGLNIDLGTCTFNMGNGHVTLGTSAYGVSMDIHAADDDLVITEESYADAEDIIALVDNIITIVEDQAVKLTGKLDLNISGTTVYLDIKDSRIDWSNGISVYVYTAIGVGDVDQDVWFSYESSTKEFMFAYGDVGAKLSFSSTSEDVATLEDAVIDLYNRVVEVLNSFSDSLNIKELESWSDLVSLIGTGSSLTDLISSLFTSGSDDGSSDLDIMSMIAEVSFGLGDNKGLAIKLDGISLEIMDTTTTEDGFALAVNLAYSTSTVSLTLDGVTLSAADAFEMPSADEVNYLTAKDFASMLDFVAAGLEVLGEKSMTMTISGTQYDYTSAYKESNYVKYEFTGTLALDWGSSTYPITTDEDGNVYIASDIYIYLGLDMIALNEADTSYTMSLYILDRDLSGNQDDALDLYVSISKKASTDSDYDPLMIYIPANDVMSLVSMAAALFDLDSLTSDSSIMQSILTAVASFVDSALIDTYIPDTQDQFRSLGDSLMGQFIDGGLQGLIDSLVDSVNDVVDTVTGGSDIVASDNRTSKDAYIKSITVNDSTFELVVDSQSVYGSAADDDLTFTATKSDDGFTGMAISNVYYNDMTAMLDMGMTIDRSVTRETSFTGYSDYSGIDTLLQTLVNSATHETTSADSELENEGEATAEEYEAAVKEYALNSNYFISGTLKLKLYLWLFTINLETIYIDGISVNVDENNKLSVDAELHYSSFKFLNYSLIDNSATVDLSIRGDMVYMRRTISGASEYRIMSLSAFGSDILDQIIWILSLGSTITDQIASEGSSSSSSTDMSGYDYGALVDAYLSSYSYTAKDTSTSWEFVINGDTLGDLAGISMTDITVTLSGSKDAEDIVYILNSLALSGRLYSFVEYDLALTYDNPQDTGSMADSLETLYDIGIYDDLTWDDILVGTTFDEICENINWDRILLDFDTTYLDYTGSDNLRVGLVEFYFSDDDGELTELGSEYVLYNASTNAIYSTLAYPDLTDYDDESNELKAVWTGYSFDTTDNIITITATRQTTYTVTVMGSEYGDETSEKTIQHVYESTYLDKDTLVTDENGYSYMLKYYTDAQGNDLGLATGVDSDGNECYILPVTEDITVYAHWEQAYGVTYINSYEGTEETIYYYAGTELTSDNMPALSERRGYTVAWNTSEDGNGESSYVVQASGNATFYAAYSIIYYDITFVSELEVSASSENGSSFVLNEDTGCYEYTVSLAYNTTFELSNEELVSQLVTVSGWTYNGMTLGAGSTVTVGDDMTFYVDFSYKTITVHYYYDMAGEDEDPEDYLYMKVTLGTDGDYELTALSWDMYELDSNGATFEITNPYVFIGWAYLDDNGSWHSVSDASDLVIEGVASVDVYAIIVKIPELTLTASETRYRSSIFSSYKYTYTGELTATGVTVVGALAQSGATLAYDFIDIEYYYNNDGNLVGNGNDLVSGTTTEYSVDSDGNVTLTDSYTSAETSTNKTYVLAWFTVTFTYSFGEGDDVIGTCTSMIATTASQEW